MSGRLRRRGFARTLLACATLVGSAAFADDVPTVLGPAEGSAAGDGISGVLPSGAAKSAKLGALRVRSRRLPRLDRTALLEQDERARAADPTSRLLRTGVRRRFHEARAPRRLGPTHEGVTVLADGSRLWTFELQSPGAHALRLHLRRFDLPRGAEAVLYDADEPSESYGPFVRRGPDGRGEFHAPTVFGERVRFEVRVPPEAAGSRLVVAIDSALEKYRGIERTAARGTHREGTCHNDVKCDAAFGGSLAYGVARIDMPSGGSCTGTLLNDYDALGDVPWFLTANHCVSTATEAIGCEVFWNYFAPSCGGTAPSEALLPRTNGATLIATSSGTDVTLLRLTGTVPAGRTFVGWTTSVPGSGASVFSVHHPGATRMRISYATLTSSDASFHNVTFTSGVTEPGSSGGPLLNSAGQVVGQLWGGYSTCGGPYGPDQYGRFDVSYPLLKPSLVDYQSPLPPPPGGGGGGGGGGGDVFVPAPVGPPLDFYFGLWQNAMLEHAQYQTWDAFLYRPQIPRRPLVLKVRAKGPKGAWVRIVDPAGTEYEIVKRGKILDPFQGEWVIELHASETTERKRHRVRVSKNF